MADEGLAPSAAYLERRRATCSVDGSSGLAHHRTPPAMANVSIAGPLGKPLSFATSPRRHSIAIPSPRRSTIAAPLPVSPSSGPSITHSKYDEAKAVELKLRQCSDDDIVCEGPVDKEEATHWRKGLTWRCKFVPHSMRASPRLMCKASKDPPANSDAFRTTSVAPGKCGL